MRRVAIVQSCAMNRESFDEFDKMELELLRSQADSEESFQVETDIEGFSSADEESLLEYPLSDDTNEWQYGFSFRKEHDAFDSHLKNSLMPTRSNSNADIVGRKLAPRAPKPLYIEIQNKASEPGLDSDMEWEEYSSSKFCPNAGCCAVFQFFLRCVQRVSLNIVRRNYLPCPKACDDITAAGC